jgi:transposase-like protein
MFLHTRKGYIHDGEGSYTCEECTSSFSGKSELGDYIHLMHGG